MHLNWTSQTHNVLRCRPSKRCSAMSSYFTWVPHFPCFFFPPPLYSWQLFFTPGFWWKGGLVGLPYCFDKWPLELWFFTLFLLNPARISHTLLIGGSCGSRAGRLLTWCMPLYYPFSSQWECMEDVSWLQFWTADDQRRSECIWG